MIGINGVLVFLFAAGVGGQIPSLGFCPEFPPMSDFNLNRFLGKWYEVERYFQISEVASRCVVTDYAKAPSGRIYVSNEVTNRLTGVKRIIGGYMELAGRADEGKLRVKYSTTPISTETTLTVLDTDYESYAVVWSCNGFGPINAQSIWVMTRERIPPVPVLQTVYGVLDKFKISRTFFVKTDQEGCALAASDINAAHGITSISTAAEAAASEQKNTYKGKNHYDIEEGSEVLVRSPSDDNPIQEGQSDGPQVFLKDSTDDAAPAEQEEEEEEEEGEEEQQQEHEEEEEQE